MSKVVATITHFLNHRTDSILGVASGLAIGAAFKDLITSLVNNVVQPLIVKLILLSNIRRLTKLINIDPLFSLTNNILNVSNVIVAIFSFIVIVFTVYGTVQLIARITPKGSEPTPKPEPTPTPKPEPTTKPQKT